MRASIQVYKNSLFEAGFTLRDFKAHHHFSRVLMQNRQQTEEVRGTKRGGVRMK